MNSKQLFKPGPLHNYRHKINNELKNIVKTGDIFFNSKTSLFKKISWK